MRSPGIYAIIGGVYALSTLPAAMEREYQHTQADPRAQKRGGFCNCGRRISWNKTQCLACKQAQDTEAGDV